METTQQCNTCQEWKPLTDFIPNRTYTSGRTNRCRACERKRLAHRVSLEAGEKRCAACHELKPRTDFTRNTSNGDGRESQCKKCASKARRKFPDEDKWRRDLNPPVLPEDGLKCCSACKTRLPLSEFKKSPKYRYGVQSWCRKCNTEKCGPRSKANRAEKWALILFHASRNSRKRKDQNETDNPSRECTITQQDILDLFEKQSGLCYWFKIPIIPSAEPRHPQKPSLDRLDCSKGYTPDNVVLTCQAANLGRCSTSAEVFGTFCKLLRGEKESS